MIQINQTQIESFKFPGGEIQVRLPDVDLDGPVRLRAWLHDSDAIMALLLSVDAIRRENSSTAIMLELPYLPYARQDRVCQPGEALALRVMADLINGLELDKVVLYDPHSDVAGALINRVEIVPQADLAIEVIDHLCEEEEEEALTIVSPDAGAEKKALTLTKRLHQRTGLDYELICASKQRNTATGEITGTTVHGDVAGKTVLIPDDICDGGRTFIELAKVLKKQGAAKVYLYVTHGIFSKGIEVLEPYFDQVFCRFAFPDTDLTNPLLITL